MQNPNEFQTRLNRLRGSSIKQLEKILEIIENKEKETNELMTKIENDAQTSNLYPSIEFTRTALLTFWGKRSDTEKHLQMLQTLGEKLDPNLKLVNKLEDLPKETQKSIEANFKVGENYSSLVQRLESLEHLKIIVQGVISEKKIEELHMAEIVKVLNDILKKNQESSQGQQKIDVNESDLSELTKMLSM